MYDSSPVVAVKLKSHLAIFTGLLSLLCSLPTVEASWQHHAQAQQQTQTTSQLNQQTEHVQQTQVQVPAVHGISEFTLVSDSRPCNRPEWIVWLGDSNMRGTYKLWCILYMSKDAKKENNKEGGHRRDLLRTATFDNDDTADPDAFGMKWADQELVAMTDYGPVRSSFRFLHGSYDELDHAFDHWHESRMGSLYKKHRHDANNNNNNNNNIDEAADDDLSSDEHEHRYFSNDTVRPSDFAIFATRNQLVQDYNKEDPKLASILSTYEDKQPKIVVLTEGWGGTPNCSYVDEMLAKFEAQPDVSFIWAPVYVTNHKKSRYECFQAKLKGFAGTRSLPSNLKLLDFWDEASKLDDGNGKNPVHIPLGGDYMKKAIGEIEKAMCELLV